MLSPCHSARTDVLPVFHPLEARVPGIHCLLELYGTFNGVHGAGELHQHTIAHHFDNPAVMLGEKRLSRLRVERSQNSPVLEGDPSVANPVSSSVHVD
jgi:hypothetical protein